MSSAEIIIIIFVALILLAGAIAISIFLIKTLSRIFKIKAIYIFIIIFVLLSSKSLWSYRSYIKQANIIRADISLRTSANQIAAYLERNKNNMNISEWAQYQSGNHKWFWVKLKNTPPIIALFNCETGLVIDLDNNKTVKSIDWGGCI